jgi:hypothetical protein
VRRRLIVGAVAVFSLAAPAGVALAAGNEQSGPTTGDCVSDGFYGNEPNMENGAPGGPAEQEPGSQAGNVVPSQSPGPKRTDPATGEVVPGNSIGDYQQLGFNIPQLCQDYVQSQ